MKNVVFYPIWTKFGLAAAGAALGSGLSMLTSPSSRIIEGVIFIIATSFFISALVYRWHFRMLVRRQGIDLSSITFL